MKTTYLRILTVVFLLLIGNACKQINTEHEPHWFKQNYNFNNKEYTAYFIQNITDSTLDITFGNWVQEFYKQNNAPIWTANGFQEHKVDTMMAYLERSWQHGIDGEYFQKDTIQSIIKQLKAKEIEDEDLFATLFKLELLFTDNYLKYTRALQYGATDPKVVNGGKWLYETLQPDSTFVKEALNNCYHLPKALNKLQPSDETYLVMQEELIRLHNLEDTAFTRIPIFSLHKGQTHSNVQYICKRLKKTGELASDFQDITQLNDELLDAINQFRSINAIPTSDSLDKETIQKLNRPISYYTDKIAANLERMRWKVVPEKEHTYIVVNLPDFTLQTIVEDTLAFKTRICCGKTQNPDLDKSRYSKGMVKAFKAETPLLHSEIRSLILNPEWSIPYDIIKNEYLYKLRANNMAVINRERLYVVDARTGKRVIPDSINWNNVSSNNIPYRLKQTSGRHNALGRIKFDFSNNESVYLHDTNNKGAFKHRKRTFSHGCVRVENPFELAKIIYQLNGYDSLRVEQLSIIVGEQPTTEEGEKFLEDMQKKDSIHYANLSDKDRMFYRKLKPTGITLKQRMPLYIEYYTCYVDDENQIQYREDMYYKDDNILKILHGFNTNKN